MLLCASVACSPQVPEESGPICDTPQEDRERVRDAFDQWVQPREGRVSSVTVDAERVGEPMPDACAYLLFQSELNGDFFLAAWFDDGEEAEEFWRLRSQAGSSAAQPVVDPPPLPVLARADTSEFAIEVVCLGGEICLGASARIVDDACPRLLFEVSNVRAGADDAAGIQEQATDWYPSLRDAIGPERCLPIVLD